MASPAPLFTGTARPTRAALLSVGPFGARVAEFMEHLGAGTRLPQHTDPEDAFDGSHNAVVLALWRPAPELADHVDILAHRAAVPWLPVVLEPGFIRVGPVVFPGVGPCHRCYAARAAQHDSHPRIAAAIANALDHEPAHGPRGHLPQHARTAAGLAASVLRRPAAMAGHVLSVMPRRRSVQRDAVVAVHGCSRCGRPGRSSTLAALLGSATREESGAR